MEEHSLISLADGQRVTQLCRRPAFDVPQHEHLLLRWRERSDSVLDDALCLSRQELLLRLDVPTLRRCSPIATRLEAGWVDRRLALLLCIAPDRRERHAAPFTLPA